MQANKQSKVQLPLLRTNHRYSVSLLWFLETLGQSIYVSLTTFSHFSHQAPFPHHAFLAHKLRISIVGFISGHNFLCEGKAFQKLQDQSNDPNNYHQAGGDL